jgi:hypothetical protein
MRAVCRALAGAAALATVLSLAPGPARGAAKWDPIDPKELAETTPKVEKDADAEALAWEVRVADETVGHDAQLVFSNYLRIKVFTDRGRDAMTRIDIPHLSSVRVRDVEGRSVKRDGTITELGKDDIHERTIVRAGGEKVQATSFALPGVETGGIVEYRWREVHDQFRVDNMSLVFYRDIPVRRVRYRLIPRGGALPMQGHAFQSTPDLVTQPTYSDVTLENVPAYWAEPYSAPAADTQPWMLIFYGRRLDDPDEFWLAIGKSLADIGRGFSPTADVKREVASLPLAGTSIDEKIAALVGLCRSKVKRMDVDTTTDGERRGYIGNRTPVAALSQGRGDAADVRGLFVAMARAAGLDARIAAAASRNEATFDRAAMLRLQLAHWIVAIRDGDAWRFVDPTSEYGPAGHLPAALEGVTALVGDEDSLVWAATPVAPPEWSLRARTATLRLSEDGTLEGDLTTELGGHLGMARKESVDHLAPAERTDEIRDFLLARLPGAEVSGVGLENLTDPDKPYVERCHLKVAGYAQRTGTRLFVLPAVFEKGLAPFFTASRRVNPILFPYAFKEADRVRIELPAGYEIESPGAPASALFSPFGRYSVKVTATLDGRAVELARELVAGGGNRLQMPAGTYLSLKQFFDAVARGDAVTLTLRKSAGPGERP